MNSTLPADPYKCLGVSKDATLAEIRSAHRKLVLKCHPDKVQDADQKAIKQDEFQKVQQAYELLSDETRRLQYDEQVKLFELRKEMGKGNPSPRANPFEYEVRDTSPKQTSYSRPPHAPKVYSYPSAAPRSAEDFFDYPSRHEPRKRSSYDTADRRRREEDRDRAFQKHEEEERIKRESKRSAHSKKDKTRDKERRRGTEEKIRTRTTAYVESDSDDDYQAARAAAEKKAARRMEDARRMEEDIARREAEARAQETAAREAAARAAIKPAPMTKKWEANLEFAGKYQQASRRTKVASDDEFHHPGMPRRAETFGPTSASYNVRYATPTQQHYSDEEDFPRRSSGRRASETPSTRRDRSGRERHRSPPTYPTDHVNIVEPPSPPPPTTSRKPSLQTYASAPPTIPSFPGKPHRSKTQEYPRHETIPPLPRAQTFQENRGRERGGSRLKQEVTSGSESDSPHYPSPRQSPRTSETTRYFVKDSRAVPVAKQHRSDLRDLNEYPRERSESPHGTSARHAPERPSIPRNPPSGEHTRAIPIRSQSSNYYPTHPAAPIPVIHTVRPKLEREGSGRGSSRAIPVAGGYFGAGDVKYAPAYTTADVTYATHAAAQLYGGGARRGSDGRDPYYPPRGREGIYT